MGANSRGGLLKTFCSRVGANSREGLIRGRPIRGFTASDCKRWQSQYDGLFENGGGGGVRESIVMSY